MEVKLKLWVAFPKLEAMDGLTVRIVNDEPHYEFALPDVGMPTDDLMRPPFIYFRMEDHGDHGMCPQATKVIHDPEYLCRVIRALNEPHYERYGIETGIMTVLGETSLTESLADTACDEYSGKLSNDRVNVWITGHDTPMPTYYGTFIVDGERYHNEDNGVVVDFKAVHLPERAAIQDVSVVIPSEVADSINAAVVK